MKVQKILNDKKMKMIDNNELIIAEIMKIDRQLMKDNGEEKRLKSNWLLNQTVMKE